MCGWGMRAVAGDGGGEGRYDARRRITLHGTIYLQPPLQLCVAEVGEADSGARDRREDGVERSRSVVSTNLLRGGRRGAAVHLPHGKRDAYASSVVRRLL